MHIDTTALCLFKSNCNAVYKILVFLPLLLPLEQFCKAFKLRKKYLKIEINCSPVEGSILSPYQRVEGHIVFDTDPVCIDMTHSLCALLCK